MDLKDFKLYGVCVERLKYQIKIAREQGRMCGKRVLLESYCTGDIEEITDILELYDLKDKTHEALMSMLSDLSDDVSLFLKDHRIGFDFNKEGELCLYWLLTKKKLNNAKQPPEKDMTAV
ncbi:hypothetical protein ACFLZI_02980 [Nitrospirota bacterium]